MVTSAVHRAGTGHPQGAASMSVLRTKTIEQSIAETDEEGHQLKKRLSALDLTVFGIGVIIGAGIFTVTGKAAAQYAGPAIVISFIIGAICCGLAALCYAEFASTVPVSGSAYTFSYASLGELVAALTTLIAIGIKESMRVNLVLVGLKLFIVLFVIFAGIGYVKTSNYTPFIPT